MAGLSSIHLNVQSSRAFSSFPPLLALRRDTFSSHAFEWLWWRIHSRFDRGHEALLCFLFAILVVCIRWHRPTLPNYWYPPVRRCIYCGTTELPAGITRFTDEHIIALGLGGNLVLQEASCDPCREIINKQIETPVLDHEWGRLRIRRGFPTRGRSKSKKHRTHVRLYRRDGSAFEIPTTEYSAPTPIYTFSEPRILTGAPRNDAYHWKLSTMIADNDLEKGMLQRFPEWNGQHRVIAQPYPFARMLAKIGYARVVAEWGYGAFHPYVLDIIMGRSDDYFHTVGGSQNVPPPIPGGDHILDIEFTVFDGGRRLRIACHIRLFSSHGIFPPYVVVVGEVDFQRPQHRAAVIQHRADGKIPNVPL